MKAKILTIAFLALITGACGRTMEPAPLEARALHDAYTAVAITMTSQTPTATMQPTFTPVPSPTPSPQ